MNQYETSRYELVNNEIYRFKKLTINGRCHIQEFYESIQKQPKLLAKFDAIIAYMDKMGPHIRYPQEIFRQIKGVDRQDVFEFKKKPLRVYVVKQEPDIFVVLGGMKNEQDDDIRWLKKALKDFDTKNNNYEQRTNTEIAGILDSPNPTGIV